MRVRGCFRQGFIPSGLLTGQSVMPRVVPDQKNKYETDELFKKLSQDVDVKALFVWSTLHLYVLR